MKVNMRKFLTKMVNDIEEMDEESLDGAMLTGPVTWRQMRDYYKDLLLKCEPPSQL